MDAQKRNKILLIVAIVLLLANLSMLTLNWIKKPICKEDFRKERMHKMGHSNFSDKISSELNLTPEQHKKYKELKTIHFQYIHTVRDSIQKNKNLIHEELMKQEPNIDYINQLSDSIGVLNAEFEKLNYNHFFELKKQLTPEQQDKFKLLIKKLPHGKDAHKKRYKMKKQE